MNKCLTLYTIAWSALCILCVNCKKVNEDCNLIKYPNAPKKVWFKSHSGTGNESHAHFLLTCSDGGYLQVGETGLIPDKAKILVIKTTVLGVLIWKKELGISGHNLGNSAFEVEDGYLICGSTNKNSALIKLNKFNGSIIFNRSHDNGGADAYEHLSVTQKGITAVGYIEAEDESNTFFTEGKAYVIFLDHSGNKINGKSIYNSLAQAYRIKSYNSEFIISGLTQDAKQYGLIKIDSIGNIIWSKNYGGSDQDHCFGMDLDDQGDVFLTGHTLSGTKNWDTYTIKTKNNGELLWEAKAGNPRGFKPKFIHDEAWDVKATSDGGCLIVAGTGDEYRRYKRKCGSDGDNSNTWHVYLVKYDASGNREWQQTYGSDQGQDWAGEAVDLTPDGGATIAVDNGEFGFLKIAPF